MAKNDSKPAAFAFLQLPSELQLKVLDRLNYDDVSRCRSVSKSMNKLCQQMLNAGFNRVERFHTRSLQRVKSQLPRRESERRTHELARHSDILTSIETRLSLLSMTYGKYLDNSLCCFIPGKVLDEIFRVLRIVNNTPRGDQPPRPHELLQELRDISSMAMEHFEEHIVPRMRPRISVSPSAMMNPAAASLSTSALVLYAAATGSQQFLGTDLATVAKAAATGTLRIAETPSRRQRPPPLHLGAVPSSIQSAPLSDAQQQRFDVLRRQFVAHRGEMNVYKRELAQLRATQQRQKGKMTEMERRLNEHEQLFADVFAQMRSGGSAVVAGTNGGETMIDGDSKGRPRLGKRKRAATAKDTSVTTPSERSGASAVTRSQKRSKLSN